MNALDFLNEIKSKDRVFIVFHNDADGVCSAAMVAKYLKSRKVYPEFVSQPIPPKKATFHRISWEKPDYIIILDMPMDQSEELLEVFGCPLLIIDHHVSKDFSSEKIIHINPRFENPNIYQSVSYIVYKILDKKENKWIAAIGAIGDVDLKDSKDLFKGLEGKEDLELMSHVIASVKAVEGRKGCEELAELLSEVESVEEFFMKGEKFLEENKTIDQELEKVCKDFEKNKEVRGNVVFYELKSKYKIRSPVAVRLSGDYTLAIAEREGGNYIVSLRSSDVDLTKVLKNVLKKVKGEGGGHPQAAGATIPARFLEKFKKEFVKEVNASLQR